MSTVRILLAMLIILSCTRNNQKTEKYTVVIKNPEVYKLSDSVRYSDFQIIVDYDNKHNYFSSTDSTFLRDYLDGHKKINLILSVAEKIKIYNIVKCFDFFGLPNTIEEGGVECTCISPASSTQITVKIGDNKKNVFYSGACSIKDKQIEYRFTNIMKVITDIIFSKKEVKGMKRSDIMFL